MWVNRIRSLWIETLRIFTLKRHSSSYLTLHEKEPTSKVAVYLIFAVSDLSLLHLSSRTYLFSRFHNRIFNHSCQTLLKAGFSSSETSAIHQRSAPMPKLLIQAVFEWCILLLQRLQVLWNKFWCLKLQSQQHHQGRKPNGLFESPDWNMQTVQQIDLES